MPLLQIPKPSSSPSPAAISSAADQLAKLIENHPYPARPLRPLLRRHLTSPLLLNPVLSRLLVAHSHGLKAFFLLRFCLLQPDLVPSPPSFHLALRILSRMRLFHHTFALLDLARRRHPPLLTPKSIAILLSKLAKFKSFGEIMFAFDRVEQIWSLAGRDFGVAEFNALLKAFCSAKKMAEAKAVFRKLCSRFIPDVRTVNTLLSGFKESGDITAMEMFYHDAVLRGFEPNAVSFTIRIDAYCKKGRFSDALQLLEEMEKKQHCAPTLETMTTLVHGAGVAKNPFRARELFDEMRQRGLEPDTGAYNALLSVFLRSRDMKSAEELMNEMEEKEGIGLDDVSYYAMFWALRRLGDAEGVDRLCGRMTGKGFVPKVRTVVLLMKFFCEAGRPGLGLELWDYMVEKGCCPHGHALDLLVTGLGCRGRVEEAFKCFKQVVERGRRPPERSFRVLEGILVRAKEPKKAAELGEMMNRLQKLLPASC